MPIITDIDLLRRYADEKSDSAFTELVQGRINFVYGLALRQVGGDAHLAEEVVQSVFIALAHKAEALAQRPVLVSWLYTSTRLAAAEALRTRSRWINRQQEAHKMQTLDSSAAESPEWREIRPVLDDAMHELGEEDRTAVLLRFFEGQPLAEIGRALGLRENTARMRVDRALEKLRRNLERRGVTSTAAALAAAIAAQPAIAAPAGLAATVSGVSLSAIATGLGASAIPLLMSTTKITFAAICAVAVVGTGAYMVGTRQADALEAADQAAIEAKNRDIASSRQENLRLKEEYRKLAESRSDPRLATAVDEASTSGSAAARAQSPDIASVFAELVKSGAIPVSAMNRIPFLGKDRQLSDAFAALFSVTPAERKALQQAVDDARSQLGAIGAANASVQREQDGSVVITVPAFSGGAAVQDQLMKTFQQILGPERGGLFDALAAGQVNTTLAQYGKAQQTLTLKHNPNPAPGSNPYQVRDQRTWKDEKGGNNNDSEGYPVADFGTIETSFGPLAKLIPADF